MGVGWGGGENFGIVKKSHPSPKLNLCRLCWPCSGEGEDSAGETSPALSGDGEALMVGSSCSSWDIPNDQGSQDIEGDE